MTGRCPCNEGTCFFYFPLHIMNILIINDQTMLREGMAYFLEKLSDEYNVLQAASLEAARDTINDAYIDLVIGENQRQRYKCNRADRRSAGVTARCIYPFLLSVFRAVIRITPDAGRH